jgi:hypothetical protein
MSAHDLQPLRWRLCRREGSVGKSAREGPERAVELFAELFASQGAATRLGRSIQLPVKFWYTEDADDKSARLLIQ